MEPRYLREEEERPPRTFTPGGGWKPLTDSVLVTATVAGREETLTDRSADAGTDGGRSDEVDQVSGKRSEVLIANASNLNVVATSMRRARRLPRELHMDPEAVFTGTPGPDRRCRIPYCSPPDAMS